MNRTGLLALRVALYRGRNVDGRDARDSELGDTHPPLWNAGYWLPVGTVLDMLAAYGVTRTGFSSGSTNHTRRSL